MSGGTLQLIPAIGTRWPAEGGIYAGIVRGRSGEPDRHLILAEAKPPRPLTWHDAMAWAVLSPTEDHSDFTLPTRGQAAVLYGNLRELFQPAMYWTCVPRMPNGDAYAFVQDMDAGDQDYIAKHLQLSAFAVRSFPVDASHQWPATGGNAAPAASHRVGEVAL